MVSSLQKTNPVFYPASKLYKTLFTETGQIADHVTIWRKTVSVK
jgi:hypothetical protein